MSRANPFAFVKILDALGVRLANVDQNNLNRIRIRPLFKRLEKNGFALEYSRPMVDVLQSFGFSPDYIFDIGVDNGTPLIYEAFPKAKFILIDPMQESEQKVQIWKDRIDMSFEVCAVGAKAGTATISIPSTSTKIRHSRATLETFSEVNAARFVDMQTREVPVKRLDTLSKGLKGRFGIKIDTEGFELEVIKGAKQTLKRTDFIVAEVSVKRRYENGYRFSELVAELGKNGFEILDFLRPLRPDQEDCDILFARYDNPVFDLDK